MGQLAPILPVDSSIRSLRHTLRQRRLPRRPGTNEMIESAKRFGPEKQNYLFLSPTRLFCSYAVYTFNEFRPFRLPQARPPVFPYRHRGRGMSLPSCFATQPSRRITKNEGGDLTIGGVGSGQGQFTILRHMIFDSQETSTRSRREGLRKLARPTLATGVARVQKFDSTGKYISEFPLGDDIPVDKKDWPSRLAVDAGGNVYVAIPGTWASFGSTAPDGKEDSGTTQCPTRPPLPSTPPWDAWRRSRTFRPPSRAIPRYPAATRFFCSIRKAGAAID